MSARINRAELIEKIKNAKKCIRVLGAVAFDLPYDALKENLLEKINGYNDFYLEIIIESDTSLNYDSLISANRKVSGENRRYEYGELLKVSEEPMNTLKKYFSSRCKFHIEPEGDTLKALKSNLELRKEFQLVHGKDYKELSKEELHEAIKQKFSIKTYYLTPKIPAIQIDDEYFISFALTKFFGLEHFEQIATDHIWYDEFSKYFKAFLDHPEGAKKYSTEFTEKGNKLEVIEMYNEKRIPLGQLPRDAFLETTRVKVVVWGLIFTRNGKLLIHKRSENAKDNRNMWDKSVGGHVDIEKDIDTVKAAAREIIEELHKKEKEGQGGHNDSLMTEIDPNYLIFLGEWRPEFRYVKLYEEIEFNRDQNYYFRMNYEYSKIARNSPRHLVDGTTKMVRNFADLYVCVAEEDFEKRVQNEELENSEYLLLYPHQIMDLYKDGDCVLSDEDLQFYQKKITKHNERVAYNQGTPLPYHLDGNSLIYDSEFKITPDMDNIMNSELWENEISKFSAILEKRWKNIKE